MPPDELRVLVWHHGGALLAARIEDVVEVTDLQQDGTARSRQGTLELVTVPGADEDRPPRRAVVVRSGTRLAALPAAEVEGVLEATMDRLDAPPRWLAALDQRHVRGLLRLDDQRIGVLLALDALVPER